MEPFQLRLLGPPQVRRADHIVRGYRSRKALALLGYLAAAGHPFSRAHLTDLFWGEEAEVEGLGQLRRALSNLNSLVPGCLEADRRSVQLAGCTVIEPDVSAFEALTDQGDVESLVAAARLYRGEFMEGFYLDGCSEFEQWLTVERERWRQRIVGVWQRLIAYHSDRGEYEPALAYCQRWLALDAWQEEAYRQAMILLARCGRYREALAQYEMCRRLLAEEGSTLPAKATTTLYERIWVATVMQRISLPPQPTSFVGRERELQAITDSLIQPGCRLLTLVGPGGIGKTRLAIAAAAAHSKRFLHGVHFVPLEHLTDPDLLVPAVAHALRFTFASRQEPKTQLINFLRHKELLLILDNFEQLIGGTGLLAEILNDAPDVKLLTTSHQRLFLQGEWVIELTGLALPENGGPADLETASAVQLFLQCAGRIQLLAPLTVAELPDVAHICRLVSGSPLAIEMAAAWTRVLSCHEIGAEITRNLNILTSAEPDRPERHRSLRAVFFHSWNLLSREERNTLAALSVFRGGFSREAAGQVAGASLGMLSNLVNKSLLQRNANGRHQVHELLRQYAAERLQEIEQSLNAMGAAEWESAQDRHGCYYVTFLQQREASLKGRQQQSALAEINDDLENVRAAWAWAIERKRAAEIARAVTSLYLFYLIRGWFHEGYEAFRQAGDVCSGETEGERRLAAYCWARQAAFLVRLGHYPQAQRLLEQTIGLFTRLGVESEMAFVLNHLGIVTYLQGKYEEAIQVLQNGLAAGRQCGDKWEMAASLSYLGNAHFYQGEHSGEYHQARKCYQESLALYRELGNDWGMAKVLNDLGVVAGHTGDYAGARRSYQESLAACRAIGARRGIANALNNLSYETRMLADFAESKRHARESSLIYQEIGDQWGIVFALTNLGKATLALAEYDEVRECFSQALQLAMDLRIIFVALEILVGISRLWLKLGQGHQALELELLPFVIQHPTCAKETREDACALLVELTAQQPSDFSVPESKNKERGPGRQLEEVVWAVLAALV